MAARKVDKLVVKRTEAQHLDDRQVTIANALTRAAQGLSLAEKRLVMCAIATLDSRKETTPEKMPVTRITAAEYAELAEVDMRTAYEALKDAGKKLMTRMIRFYEPPAPGGRNKKPIEIDMRWVGEAHYRDAEGCIDLYWWWRVVPFLTGLKQQFTKYQLHQATALRSMYSWRMLELLSQFSDTGLLVISTDEFAHAMGASDKQRENFNNIRRLMIEPAVKELIEKDGWDITWEPIKRGRTVATLRFEFDTKQPKRIKPPAAQALPSLASPAAQPPAFVPEPPKPRTPEQRAKAREALEAAKKAARGKAEQL